MIRGLLNLLWRPDPDAPLEEDQVALNQLQNNDIPDRERPPDKEQVEHNQQQDENDTPDPKAPPNEEKEGSHQQQDQDDINDGDTRTNSTGPDVSRGIEDEDWMPRVAVRLSRQKTGLFQDQWRDRHAREECTYPLGMEDIWIPDSAITASSESSSNRGATRARLNKASGGGKSGSWCAKVDKEGQYLQIDLGRIATVKKIATQGRQDKAEWVTKYKVFYSKDGHKFLYQDKEYLGNTDQHTAVVNDLIQPIEARFVRICAMEWYGHISMRAELYGCYRPRETEEKIDEALKMGEFHFIKAEVNPKSLIDCKTNVLLKAFEVNRDLIKLSEKKGPEQEEFEKLADAVDEFATTLIDPLKSDDDTRNCHRGGLDYAVDKAIDLKQKKFIVHPVVDNLLRSKWHGSFLPLRNSKFTESSRWIYFLLEFWALIDMFVFPFLFALFFFIHWIKGRSRKRKDIRICFVLALSEDAMTKDLTSKDETSTDDTSTDETSKEKEEGVLSLIKETVRGVRQTYGYQPAKYCIIQREKEHISFKSPLLNVDAIKLDKTSPPLLHKDLDKALYAFTDSGRKASKKILVVFVNDKIDTGGSNGKDLNAKLDALKDKGVELIPIGLGQDARLDELKDLRKLTQPESDKEAPLAFDYLIGEYESPDKLIKTIVQGVEGKDIYERYLEYFTTPCFIFVRDTLSNLVLLGLLIYICLSPSYLTFSLLEWVIFVFLLGRIVMEIKQFAKIGHTTGDKEKTKKVTWPSKIIYYFSDIWNWFDFFILITYVTTFTLRMISWRFSDSVADNRPLAVAGYLYGLVAMLLTLRTIGHLYEGVRGIGPITIAVYFILFDMFAIFCQFVAAILAFSLMITKVYVAERSYISVGNDTEELACSTAGLDCWLFVTKHLTWSVIGIAELEPLHSVDGFSLDLVHLLYSLFLIIGAILLVNMMIALLSNTYQRVENNSLKEWSFKKAVTIKSYCECHPFPVPFNLLYLLYDLYELFKWCRRDKEKCRDELKNSTERKTKALDKLVVELERIYFATHGYTFPLTDETKVDQLLYETNGNQHMTNQIARRVFEQLISGQETGKNAWKSRGIEIEGCVLTCKAPYLCDVCNGIDSQRRHGARYNTPFTPEMPRLEVLIQESGESRILGIGAVYEKYKLHWQPGWRDGTVGYTADDGGIREPNRDGIPTTKLADAAMAYRGDLMACEVDFISKPTEPGTIPIKFFLNGREVATSKMEYTKGERELYPYIAMGCRGIRVLARMRPREESQAKTEQLFTGDMGAKQEKTQLEIIQEQLLQTIRKEMEEQRKIEKRERREMEEQRRKETEEQRKEMGELKSLLRQAIQMK